MCTCGNGHSFSLTGSWDAGILMLPVQRPVWNLVRSSVPQNFCYADREPEHIMLQSDSRETWRPGWYLLTNTHEQTAAGTQSEWLHDRFVKSQEKEYWVRVTEIDISSRSPPQTHSDSLLSAMCTFLSLCPSRHLWQGFSKWSSNRPVENLTVKGKERK